MNLNERNPYMNDKQRHKTKENPTTKEGTTPPKKKKIQWGEIQWKPIEKKVVKLQHKIYSLARQGLLEETHREQKNLIKKDLYKIRMPRHPSAGQIAGREEGHPGQPRKKYGRRGRNKFPYPSPKNRTGI